MKTVAEAAAVVQTGDFEARRVPVIVMSGLSQEKDFQRGFAAGADDYLGKPFSMEELLARVTRHLARVEASRALRRPPRHSAAGTDSSARSAVALRPRLPRRGRRSRGRAR